MSAIAVELGVILLLLVLNGLFAMSEMAVVAARRSRLEHRAERGDKGAQVALEIASSPANFLSTVQVGITLVGVLAGAFGGAEIADELAVRFAAIPWLAPYAKSAAFGSVVAIITYLSLIIGELVPKRIALDHPERIAAFVSRPMRLISTLGTPLVWLLTGSTTLVFRLLGFKASTERGVTEQDIRAMVEQGAEEGSIEPVEHEIVENAFRLGDRTVSELMTPRPDVRWLDVACPPEEIRAALAECLADARGSRLLICEDTIEEVLGVVHAEDLLARYLAGHALDRAGITAVLQQPVYVPATLSAFVLLRRFRETRNDLAVVLDEFGGVQGVATVDDLVEAVIGELPQRGAPDAPDIVRQPDGSWLVDGDAPIQELDETLDVDEPSGPRRGYASVGGLVLTTLGRVPQQGDQLEYAGYALEVVAMEGRRVGRVRVASRTGGHRVTPAER